MTPTGKEMQKKPKNGNLRKPIRLSVLKLEAPKNGGKIRILSGINRLLIYSTLNMTALFTVTNFRFNGLVLPDEFQNSMIRFESSKF